MNAHRTLVASRTDTVDLEVRTVDGHLLKVFVPTVRPELWAAYLDGIEEAYTRFGVMRALDLDQLADPASTSLAFLVCDDTGPGAGLRCHGPLEAPREVVALEEMAASPEIDWFEDYVNELLRTSVVLETKGAWASGGNPDRRALAACASRCNVYALDVFGADHALCTAPLHTRALYESTGATVVEAAGVSAYPDDRYETAPMVWSSERVMHAADPTEWSGIVRERASLRLALATDAPLDAGVTVDVGTR